MNGDNPSQDLTGVWQGRYSYPRALPAVPFVATLIESATRLTGAVSEPGPSNDGSVAYATLFGQRDGAGVAFVKTYADQARFPRPIDYIGTLNKDATAIEGTWRIDGVWSGKFIMTRPRRQAETISRKVAEHA